VSDDTPINAPATPRRLRWGLLLWMLAGLFAAAAGLSALTARQVSRPLETLLEDTLTPEKTQSAAMAVATAPTIVVIEVSQVLKPVRDSVTSQVVVHLLQVSEPATSTAPAHRPLLELDHEFSRTPDGAETAVRTHATITEPGTYVLGLGRMELSFEGAGGPVQVRVDRVRASAVPFEAGAVVLGLLAMATAIVAAVTAAVRFVARVRREEESKV